MAIPLIGGAIAGIKALGTGQKIGLSVLALLAIGAAIFTFIKVMDDRHENTIEVAEEAGAAKAVKAGQDVTLGQIGAAHEAGNKVRNGLDFSKFCQCMRDVAGDGGVCQRYRPDKYLPDRPEDPCPPGP